jgi:peptidyl-prolyl cis-trans isomerase D
MLAAFRRHLDSWLVRAFFLLLVLAFAVWGVGDVIRLVGTDRAVATVAGIKLDQPTVANAFQRQLQSAMREQGGEGEASAALRREVAVRTVDLLITQTAMNALATRLGIIAPTQALRAAVLAIPTFQGPDGRFDRHRFEEVLAHNGLDEDRFLELLADDMRERQIVSAVRAGVSPPALLTDALYRYEEERRVALAAELPFSAFPPPPAPDEAKLRRFWRNHPDLYSTPEYRRIKAIVLTPEDIAKSITFTDDELKAAYDAHAAEFSHPERRSFEVVVAKTEENAKKLAALWQGGADFTAVDKEAQALGESTLKMDEASANQIPIPELAKALFSAPEGVIIGPLKTEIAWYVGKVTKIVPAEKQSFEAVKEKLAKALALEKAAEEIEDRATKLEDAIAGAGSLDQVPADLGARGLEGTLDSAGLTREGNEAPLPGPDALRQAIIKAAFAAKPGDPPRLVSVDLPPPVEGAPPQRAYYAVSVEEVIPPALKPFEQVREAVARDYIAEQQRHEAEEAAAQLMMAVKGGEKLEDAALKAGVQVRRLPPVRRTEGAEGVPAQLLPELFALKKGEPTMVETADSFVVAVLDEIIEPDPKQDALTYGKIRDALTERMGNDAEELFVTEVRKEAHPRVNERLLDQIAAP